MDKLTADVREGLRSTFAGMILLEEVHLEEMRAILEAALKEGRTRKELAAELGLSTYKLRSYLAGAGLSESEWDRLAQWCADKPNPSVSPYKVAVLTLCHLFPANAIPGVRADLLAAFNRIVEERRVRLPAYAFDGLREALREAGWV
jgi:hypothetical protein